MTQPLHTERTAVLKALAWVSGTATSFVGLAISGRELAGSLDTFEIMFYRSIIGLAIVCVALAASSRGFAQIRTARVKEHVIRNLFHFTGQNLWLAGIAIIPLAQLVALEFSSPIWVALLAPMLLGEPLTRRGLLAILVGFVGILLVARPEAGPLSLGHAAGLACAICFAVTNMFTRKITREDGVLTVLFWMTASQTLMGLLLALQGGLTLPSEGKLIWILIIGAGGLSAHFCLTKALSTAPATIVAPMEFIRLPMIAAAGMLLYAEPVMLLTFIGAGLILCGNLINLTRPRAR